MSILRSAIEATGGEANATDDEVLRQFQRDLNINNDRTFHRERQGLYQPIGHISDTRERSSAQTYLRDTVAEKDKNGNPKYPLTILTSTLATRIILDTRDHDLKPRAVGVEYLHGQALYRADPRHNGTQTGVPGSAFASKEVIVSGGAFNTPQILKLSGIGPRDELESFDIPVVVDLPAVGTNMQDNYESSTVLQASHDFESFLANCTFLQGDDPCLIECEEQHTGPYSDGPALAILYQTSVAKDENMDLFFFGGPTSFFGYYPGFSRDLNRDPRAFTLVGVKMDIQSRAGYVRLRSADPQDVPEINFNFFQDGAEHDLQALAEGTELVKRILNGIGPPYAPFTQIAPNPDIDLHQAIMDDIGSHHVTSSCPIGVDNTTSCVDSSFRVHGVDGLRVVDGSVFPRVPGAFPVLPTFLISEKATEVILRDCK